MSKKEKVIQGIYDFTGYVNTILIAFFVFLGTGYVIEDFQQFSKREYMNIMFLFFAGVLIGVALFMLSRGAKNIILLIPAYLICVGAFLLDYKSIITVYLLAVINISIRKFIEFVVKKRECEMSRDML
ncbi:hypothetical protein [Faecalimonas sp.]